MWCQAKAHIRKVKNHGGCLAQRNVFLQQDYLNAQYDYVMNVLRLKASVGKLTERDIEEMNAWLMDKTAEQAS